MTSVTSAQLNAMNQLLYQMWALKPNQRRPVFSVPDIVDAWHMDVDDTTSEAEIVEILELGASTGFFLFFQCKNGEIFYGFNSNMLKFNKANKQILLDALPENRICLESCNTIINPTCIFKDPTPDNCCFTQYKGTVAGGSISSVCGASMSTNLFMCADQQTQFCP